LLNVNSNQLNQSKIKNIEDGAKGSGFFFFFYYKRRSGACCVAGFSCSKLWSRISSGVCYVAAASFGACCVVAASKLAPEPEILRSLLRYSSKQVLELPELAAFQQQASSGALRSSELAGRAAGSGGLQSSELFKDV